MLAWIEILVPVSQSPFIVEPMMASEAEYLTTQDYMKVQFRTLTMTTRHYSLAHKHVKKELRL